MIDATRELIQLLSQDVTVAQISERIGPVIADKKPPLALELKPKLGGVKAARLLRYPKTAEPFTLDLELRPAARPTVAAMREALGEYQLAAKDIGRPKQLIFKPPAGAGWKVVVIVDLASRSGPVRDTDQVVSVSFRRDRVKH